MKKINKIFVIILILINISIISLSHSGRTDSNGGHYDRSTGEYHYHNGGSSSKKYIDTSDDEEDDSTTWEEYKNKKKFTTLKTYEAKTKQNTTYDNPNFKNYPHLSTSEKIVNWIEENPDTSFCIILIGICLAFNLIISLFEEKKKDNKDLKQTTYIYTTDYTTSSTQTETNKPIVKTQNNYTCPLCGGQLQLKNGRYGKFIGCKNYPNCKYTKSLKK